MGAFDRLLLPIVNEQASNKQTNKLPVRKLTVRNVKSPWLDQELKAHMMERDRAKADAIKSVSERGWSMYRKLRNFVTMLNKNKNKMYYHKKISSISDSKTIWNILNQLVVDLHHLS